MSPNIHAIILYNFLNMILNPEELYDISLREVALLQIQDFSPLPVKVPSLHVVCIKQEFLFHFIVSTVKTLNTPMIPKTPKH